MVKDYRPKRGSKAWAISDRSGMRFPMCEMIREPGTNTFIHKSESDGRWNEVDHPQAHVNKYARFGDPFPVLDAHPDISWVVDLFLRDESGNIVTDEHGLGLEVDGA